MKLNTETNLHNPCVYSRSSRTSTRMVTATSPGRNLKRSGITSLTSASLESWTRTSERLQIYSLCPCRFARLNQLHKLTPSARAALTSLCFPPRRDGKISREEMIDYFLKASSLLNCKMGFIHTFTEATYVKPTFCEHCAGFVSTHLLPTWEH